MAMERYVYVLNSDKYSNENIPYSFDTKNRAFALNQAFTNTSVNPIIKSTNITAEYDGVSANFFEIRSGPYDGMISADNSDRIVNRIYPTANATDIAAYAKNRQQTRSYKIRTHSSKSNETHNSKVIGLDGLDINLDTNDYFVLINPEITHPTSDKHPSIRPHFARITQLISYDTYGDGFEFEPKYTGPISKDTNFEIYKGPAATDTDVVAVSYGLRGDGNEINPETTDDTNFDFITDKYDASNQASKPTWYFYNDRLQTKDQLDYGTKYNLTTCRWWANWTDVGDYANGAADTQFAFNALLTTPNNQPTLIIGQSVYYKDNSNNYIYMGNVATDTSSNFTVDYARNALPLTASQTDLSVYVGRTVHQTVFRTEREYGDEIQDLGPRNQHATFVDNIHTKDAYFNDQYDIGNNETLDENQAIDYEESSDLPASSPAGQYTFNPSIWKDAFRNFRRTTNDLKSSASGYTTAGTISTLHANLTGPKRYLYYKSSHLKNNAVIPVTELRVNNPKEKISQIARVKTLDGSGIQFLKLKEDADLVVTKAIHTNTLKEFKLPYYVNSSYNSDDGHSIVLQQVPDTEVDYPTMSLNDILRVNDTYYRIVDKGPVTSSNKLHFYVSHKKLSDAATWSALSSESDMETFTGADVYVMAWNGGLNSSCPIDSEGVYASNTLQRLTMHGNTISLKDNSLYNKKISLLNPEFYGHDITINYGDSLHNHIKLKSTKKFYQPDSERIDFMYYYNGNYAIEEEAFNGTIEDIESSSSEGMLTYTITGRDKTSILLNNITNNNLNKTNDIVYSTLASVFDEPILDTRKFTPSNDTNPITFAALTGNNNKIIPDASANPPIEGMEKYDLLFNDSGAFLGEVDTVTGTTTITVTLKGYTGDFPAPKVTQHDVNSILLVKLTDANYLSGTKALAANLDASKYPTDYSSIGEKGLVFHDGEKITYSSSFAYNNLLNTSSIGSFTTDRTIGYDITDVKGIAESYDSNFAFKLANEKKASIDYNIMHTTAMSNYDVVDFDSHDTGVTLKIAPKFPIVLGSIDTNASDNTWGTDMRYLYLVNSNIPNGGFIHTIQDNNGAGRNHTDYYTPYKTFRYWGMQRFKEGSIEETYDSIYNDNSKTQRITAAAPMYKIDGFGIKLTPNDNTNANGTINVDTDLTPSLISKHGSNLWTQSHLGLTDREEPKKFGITATEVKAGTYHTFTQLENIDYRAKNYELLAIGDIYPDSKLRWNNIQAQTKDFSTYGMILESAGSEGKSISHENFTGTTNNTNTSDSNYERIEITSSNKTTNQLKRFGIMRLVEATFDWHMNPVDYESTPQPKDPYKINLTKYPRMKMISSNNYIESYTYGNDSSLELHDPVTFEVGDNVYDSEGELLAVISSASTTVYIVHADLLQYVNLANRLSDKIYVMRPKTFDLFADPDWGINTQGANDMKMLHNYLVVPGVDKNYFSFGLLEYDPTNPLADEIPYDAQNIFIPIICKNLKDQVDDTLDVHVWYSLFHEAKHWDSGTSSPIWYHPSRLIYALAYPTTQDDSPETGLRQDGIQYKISNAVDLYGESIVLFKDMHTSTKNNESSFKLPTSGVLGPGTKGGLTQWAGYLTEIANDRADQRAVNVTQQILGSDYGYDYTICGPKTIKHIYAEDGNRNWTRSSYHSHSNVDNTGQLFQAQTFIKPRLILTSADTDLLALNITLDDDSKNNWLDFVPDLTGYYLVSDKMGNKYLPSNDNASNHAVTGTPDYIGKITEHTIDTDSGGDFPVSRHTLKLDKTLNTSNVGTAFRLMKISETTFEDTPDYFEVNKMFDTGLKYDALHQNFVTGVEEESGSELDTTEYLAYQQGLYAMYLLLDIDTINSYPDRRTLTAADDLFSDGDSLNCWVTDGTNSVEKNILVSRTTGSKLKFSYDGKLTGYGVVSFGETFTIETPKISKVRNPKTAYIGTTFSIGTDAELAIEEILEENGIQVDTSEKQLNYTSNIVDETNGSVIDIEGTLVGVEEGEIIYNQDGKLIGKVGAAVGGADITIEDIFYKPVKNDEITKYSRKPHILNTNFTDQDVFSAINYLAAKKSLDYNFDEDKIKIRNLDNYNTHRKFALKYRDGTNLISVDSNTSLFDKASKIIVIGDNVKAEVEEPSKKPRTIKHIDSNIKNSQEARIKAYELLELHNKPSRKIDLTLEKTGFELMKAGDLISLDFPNHNIPADDYIVFEIENVMSNISKITVGTFNKTIAERLSELGANQGKGFTNLFSKNSAKTLTAKVIFDDIKMKEQSLNYEHKTTIGGTTFGFV